jgi:hypothetical protein
MTDCALRGFLGSSFKKNESFLFLFSDDCERLQSRVGSSQLFGGVLSSDATEREYLCNITSAGPFYATEVWPCGPNTQGGPRFDPQGTVLDDCVKARTLWAAAACGLRDL